MAPVLAVGRAGYFYPRSPCGERQLNGAPPLASRTISIHALLAESDENTNNGTNANLHFYPRSPCGERRPASVTPAASRNFYPRSPCGERQARRASRQQPAGISIHALLAESDVSPDTSSVQCRLFLSTLSLRRATYDFPRRDHIH